MVLTVEGRCAGALVRTIAAVCSHGDRVRDLIAAPDQIPGARGIEFRSHVSDVSRVELGR